MVHTCIVHSVYYRYVQALPLSLRQTSRVHSVYYRYVRCVQTLRTSSTSTWYKNENPRVFCLAPKDPKLQPLANKQRSVVASRDAFVQQGRC